MKPFSDGLKIVSPENVEFSKRSLVRPADPSMGAEGSPEQLMELLGDIDSLKVEIHERIRRMEAVKQAKSVLLEDAVRTEALSKKLAEIGQIMSGAQLGSLMGLAQDLELGPPRIPPREERGEVEGRPVARVAAESIALPWPKPEDLANESSDQVPNEVTTSTEMAGQERALAGTFIAPEHLENRFEEISARIAGAESSWLNLRDEFEQIAVEVRREVEGVRQRVAAFESNGQAGEAELRALQDTVRQAIEALEDRVAHAEENLRRSEQAEAEAKTLLEESTAQLRQAAQVERETTARILATEATFKASVESASQRLQEAEQFWKQRDNSVIDSKKQLDQATFALTQAHAKEESATADLVSARQELTTAYQFAAVAAQRRLDSAEFFRKAAFWAVLGTAFSWIGMVWAVWSTMERRMPIWAPAAATLVVIALAVSFSKRGRHEAQGD